MSTFSFLKSPQQLHGSKVSSIQTYCIHSEPVSKAEYTNKNAIVNVKICAYEPAPGKTRENLPNQSRKIEYAAFAKRFGRTQVIHG